MRSCPRRVGRAQALLLGLAGLSGCAAPSRNVPAGNGPVTFTKDVAPILFTQCASCHRPGEPSPFSVLTYQDVRPRATRIVDATGRRSMPPWLPTHGYGEFANERRLS